MRWISITFTTLFLLFPPGSNNINYYLTFNNLPSVFCFLFSFFFFSPTYLFGNFEIALGPPGLWNRVPNPAVGEEDAFALFTKCERFSVIFPFSSFTAIYLHNLTCQILVYLTNGRAQ